MVFATASRCSFVTESIAVHASTLIMELFDYSLTLPAIMAPSCNSLESCKKAANFSSQLDSSISLDVRLGKNTQIIIATIYKELNNTKIS